MILLSQGQRRRLGWSALVAGALLALTAVLAFLGRPKMADAEDRYALAHPAKVVPIADGAADDGAKSCTIDLDRSRVTVSKTEDVALDWKSDGCVNGKTQYGANAGLWSRTFVPNTEATVTIQSFDPAKSRYTVERYLMSAEAMDKARAVRAGYSNNACTADPARRQSVADMESAIRVTLPPQPNERLVYNCRPGSVTAP